MNTPIKVRFAPSPTGYLRIGGVRTALFNWLFARHHGGKFVLRVEDTDASRSTEESIQEIIQAMHWLGLDWDEGPFRQMERQSLYKEKISTLLKEGKAYHCICTPEELETKRKEAQSKGLKPKYDGACRNRSGHSQGIPGVVRIKAPLEGNIIFQDALRGKIVFDARELDDFILQRSDGTPTYNFVVVVDDADMGITHVIRGDDHLSNTPKQVLLYDALNYPQPRFAHISMILGQDKTRLSKRHGATSTLAYRKMGYLPDAMINYLVRLGWSYGDQEIFTREELVRQFTLENITTSAAVFNPEKLLWLNQHYIQNMPPVELAEHLEPILIQEEILSRDHGMNREEIARPIPALNKRSQTLVEMAQKSVFYFKKDVAFDENARAKFLTQETRPLLLLLKNKLSGLEEVSEDQVEGVFKEIVAEERIKLGKIAQPVRIALTGKKESPGIYETIALLGKETTLERLTKAINWIEAL